MGNASSESALLNEKKIHMNQVMWDNQRHAELNRIFSKNFRNQKEKKKPFEFENHHNNFLKKIEKENEEKKKKYEIESKMNKKILGDNHYFKLYMNNFQIGKLDKQKENISLKGSFSPKVKLNKNMRIKMKIFSEDKD